MSSDGKYEVDSEKGHNGFADTEHSVAVEHVGVARGGFFSKLWDIVLYIDRFGVEVRGIERVPPDHRPANTIWDLLDCTWFWLAANCTISTVSLGTLGPSIFFLGLKESILTIVFFNLLSTIPVAYFATFGPRLGLRQMTLTRFSFGYYTAWVPVILNCIACIGWSTINSIVGGQTLRAVSQNHQIPEAAAIIVIALGTLIFALFGYKWVHLYERYSWIPVAIIFVIVIGLSAKYMEVGDFAGTGSVEAASVLSFGASVVGFGLGWSSLASDYTVNMPENVSAWKVFILTYIGLNVPCILLESLGAALTTVTRPDWQQRYTDGGVGGLLGAALSPAGGFGQFLLVILGLSIVANNIPNMYSFALTFQVLGRYAQAIPRFFLVILGTVIYIVLALVGASHFAQWLDTLLVLLSYWLAIYTVILLEEHLIFRKGKWSNYNPEDIRDPKYLPTGLAAALALSCGIAGAVLGMAALWYVGVIGRKIGDPAFGGDLGFELAGGFTAVTYPVFRAIERHFEDPARFYGSGTKPKTEQVSD